MLSNDGGAEGSFMSCIPMLCRLRSRYGIDYGIAPKSGVASADILRRYRIQVQSIYGFTVLCFPVQFHKAKAIAFP